MRFSFSIRIGQLLTQTHRPAVVNLRASDQGLDKISLRPRTTEADFLLLGYFDHLPQWSLGPNLDLVNPRLAPQSKDTACASVVPGTQRIAAAE